MHSNRESLQEPKHITNSITVSSFTDKCVKIRMPFLCHTCGDKIYALVINIITPARLT